MGSQPEEWASEIRHVWETRDLGDVAYPLLVTFTDITDPTTVKQVDPNHLAATFGEGVSLKRITLEITDEPVTEGKIESVLGWLNDAAILKNPAWRNLPSLAQTAVYGLRKPLQQAK